MGCWKEKERREKCGGARGGPRSAALFPNTSNPHSLAHAQTPMPPAPSPPPPPPHPPTGGGGGILAAVIENRAGEVGLAFYDGDRVR